MIKSGDFTDGLFCKNSLMVWQQWSFNWEIIRQLYMWRIIGIVYE